MTLTDRVNAVSFPENTTGLKLSISSQAFLQLTQATSEIRRTLDRSRIANTLSTAEVTRKVNNDGFNIKIPRNDNETLGQWNKRTSGLAEEMKTASHGEITPVAVSKGGRIVVSVNDTPVETGLFSKPAYPPITQGLFSSVA